MIICKRHHECSVLKFITPCDTFPQHCAPGKVSQSMDKFTYCQCVIKCQ
jgi:hypothetical protein|eukprot:SAG25_NODE_570_length_6860_cov_10.441799_9_plen_49_part_00